VSLRLRLRFVPLESDKEFVMRASAGLVPCYFSVLMAALGCSQDGERATREGVEPSSTDASPTGHDRDASSGPDGARPDAARPDVGSTKDASTGPTRTVDSDVLGRDTGVAPSSPEAGLPDCPPVTALGDGPTRTVTVDAQQIVGTIRSLQGAHWDPGPAKAALSLNYVAMGVDMIRTHDIGGINGTGAGDVDGPGRSRMFPNMNADPNLEASYNFGPTDNAIQNIKDIGAEVFFRVGRSNISGGNTVPQDFDKYAEIVKHIVMHYNQGWASGVKLGIRYFEIWNEPDFLPFWKGTGAQYHELYKKLATAIKAVDPNALVGAPANSTFNDKTGLRATFLKYLNDNKLPLDFYSFHKYTNKSQDPMDFARMARSYRDELDKFDFTYTQIVNSEWETSLQGDTLLGGEAGHAAFLADALIYMQDAPVDKSQTYMQIRSTQSKEGLAFGVLSKLNSTPTRLCAQGGDDNGFGVLAGLSTSGPELQVVIANYQIAKSLMGPIPGGNEESLEIPGLGHLADMTYPERRTFTYPDKDGYALTVKAIPESWGDVTVKQYRIDANNNLTLVATKVFKTRERTAGALTVSGTWARARPSATDDPEGAAQGVDLVVVTGTAATPAAGQ
jgi:xylan 1,4-beta-xylosidase